MNVLSRLFSTSTDSDLTELVFVKDATAEPLINIVFVHGLDGDPIQTWAFEQENSWHTWLNARIPNATIWSLRYRLRSSNWFGGSMPIYDRAINVLATLNAEMRNNNPIVFVCHSYGGLLIKQVILSATDAAPEYAAIAAKVKGIAFLATPHTGSDIAQYVKSAQFLTKSSAAIAELKTNAPALADLNRRFRVYHGKSPISINSYYETRKTHGFQIVDIRSADGGFGRTPVAVDTDHIQICKPTRADFRVIETADLIASVMPAPPIVLPPAPKPALPLVQQLMIAKGDQHNLLVKRIKRMVRDHADTPELSAAMEYIDLMEESRKEKLWQVKHQNLPRQQENQDQSWGYGAPLHRVGASGSLFSSISLSVASQIVALIAVVREFAIFTGFLPHMRSLIVLAYEIGKKIF